MPVSEHPFGGSWGYQPLGLFAPSARFGPPEGFARFVDACHRANIGVIVDWVPAHFPTDAHGMARFDGTALYEHQDPREGFHQDWNTYIYNFGRREVQGFLIASGLYWLEHFHVDGLRVDAVASMLYRDYSRRQGEWIPNVYGGRENLEAIGFLRHFNAVVGERCAGAITIAEESTAWPGVSRPISEGGLGFAYKWNMGWMHDTLRYIEHDPVHRPWHHNDMTFGLLYAFAENFVLPLSHDEVVYGKHSLIGKMPGDNWQRFANLRAYFGFMWGHPGKKLLFMGGEIAQEHEWSHDGELDWAGARRSAAAGRAAPGARPEPPLCGRARAASARHGVHRLPLGGRRRSAELGVRLPALRQTKLLPPVLVVCNMTPVPRSGYRIGVPRPGDWRELLNTDAAVYGGSNMGNGGSVADGAGAAPWRGAVAGTDVCRRWRRCSCGPGVHDAVRRMQHLPDALLPGRPFPLGATWDGLGINFAVFSAHAERIDLCLFEPSGRHEIARYTLPEYTDEIWHGYLPDATAGLLYGYRAFGPYDPHAWPPLQPQQAAARSLCARAGGRRALVRCAVWVPAAFAARRSVVRSARQRAGDAEGRGDRRLIQLGRRSSARRAVVGYRDLRGACARADDAA